MSVLSEVNSVKVWDPLVRVFHWTLFSAFILALATGDDWARPHAVAGYVMGVLIAVRLVWGLIGTRHARFSDFVRGPRAVRKYLAELLSGSAPRVLGHNPAGGAMIVLLLIMLMLTVVSGLALEATESARGPLAGVIPAGHFWKEFYEEGHEVIANFTLFLVLIHVSAVILSSWLHGENLIRAMITGRKAKEL